MRKKVDAPAAPPPAALWQGDEEYENDRALAAASHKWLQVRLNDRLDAMLKEIVEHRRKATLNDYTTISDVIREMIIAEHARVGSDVAKKPKKGR